MTTNAPGFIYDVIRTSLAANLVANYRLEMRPDNTRGCAERLRFYDLYVSNQRALGWMIAEDRDSAAHSVAFALASACGEDEFLIEARPPVWAAAACVRHSLTAPGAGLEHEDAGEFIDAVFDALVEFSGSDVISDRKRREVVDGVNWLNTEWRQANPESVAEMVAATTPPAGD